MKVVIIGCGRIALNHVKAVRANGFELAALCDTAPGKAGACSSGRVGRPGAEDLRRPSRDARRGAGPGHRGRRHRGSEHARIALDCIDASVAR